MCPNACPALSRHLSLTRDATSDQNALSAPFYPLFTGCMGSSFWASEFESVPTEATSPSLCHRKGASQDPDPKLQSGKHSCWETFLPGYVPTSLNGFYSKQHLRGEQHVTLLFWHISQQTVKLKAKSLKGIMEKTKFLLITIFKTSEVTYSGKVDIKSNNAFSVDSLPWFVKARTSEEEWELPHIAHEGQPLCRAVTQHRQGLFPPQWTGTHLTRTVSTQTAKITYL